MSELSLWLSPHPAWVPGEDWPEEVPVVCVESADWIALIDPFLPVHDDFDPQGKPVSVLLTQPAHYRGTADFVARYGASVWVPPSAAWRKRPNPATTTELPAGIEALELDGEPQQAAFYIREHRTLVTGDVLSEPLLASLDRIADLPIDRVIIPHGDEVAVDGAARIREAVAERR